MGDGFKSTDFTAGDFAAFQRKLKSETKMLKQWFDQQVFKKSNGVCGLELEGWLLDKHQLPSPLIEVFLQRTNDNLVVPELSQYNFEINFPPCEIADTFLSHLHGVMEKLWRKCSKAAQSLEREIVAIGILPTVQDDMLSVDYIAPYQRYYSLNNQILSLRGGKPIELKIEGVDKLNVVHNDVMLEAAATSMQIHLEVDPAVAKQAYNACIALSAPMVALCANSPYMYGKSLWEETRIPLFEQAVEVAPFKDPQGQMVGRVSFGTGYIQESLMEAFEENLAGYPVLMPVIFEDGPQWLSHLRFHNGAIWRWNRPLIGIDDQGNRHLRIEHRVPAAGPTLVDMVGNIAFWVGATGFVISEVKNLELRLPFAQAKQNFYQAAKDGLGAGITWLDGKTYSMQMLLQEILIPGARQNLKDRGINHKDIEYFVDQVIVPRVAKRKNGSSWQRSFIDKHGKDFQAMMNRYLQLQQTNQPVHDWGV